MKIVHSLSRAQPDRELATALFSGKAAFATALSVHSPAELRVVGGNPALMERFAAKKGLSNEDRAELIEALNAGKHIELEADLISYRQPREPGVTPNANGIRVKASAFRRMCKSAKNTPLLRDHAMYQLLARGGTIAKGRAVEEDGEQVLTEVARFTKKWAVLALLEGNFDRLSIGILPTGPIHCTACKAPVRDCWHWPLEEVDGQVVEWELQDAKKLETSGVNIPAVDNTAVAPKLQHALSAGHGKETRMEMEELLAELEKERAERAKLSARVDQLAIELASVKTERDEARAELEAERAEARRKEAVRFCNDLVEKGRLSADGALYEHLIDQYCQHGEDKAKALAAGLQAGNPALGESQRQRAKEPSGEAERKRWEIPRTEDGKIDSKKLLASMPPKVKERVERLMARSSYAPNPLGVLRGLANPVSAGDRSPSTLAQLLEADGYEPITRKELD